MRSSQYSNLRPQTFGQLLFIHEMQQLFLLSLTFLVGKVFPLLHIRNIYASAHYTPSFPLEKYNHNNIMLSKRNTKPLLDSKDNSNIASTVENKLKEEENMEKNLSNSYIVLGILLLTFASNQWSRQAMYYLSDFSSGSVDAFRYMNRDLDFSKEMYAALASFGFTAVFATVSLFSGDVSDRYSRNRVTTISCLVWSLATALQAYATKFSDLVPLRAIIGASQAFYNPAAYTLLADIFPARMVGSVNGIFSGGIYLGGALASLSIVLDSVIGWRNTLLVIGGLGLLASALCFIVVPEPREEASQKPLSATSAPPSSLAADPKKISNLAEFSKDAISALFEVLSPYQAKLLLSAATLRFCAGFSIGIWKAPFIFDKFPGNEVAFSGSNAVIMTVGGLASTFLGGYLSDVLSNPKSKDIKPRARSWIPAIGSLVAAPLFAGFVLASSPESTALFLLGEYLAAECWFGPTLAALFQVVPKERRGAAQGLFSLTTALGNFGPVLVGRLAGEVGGTVVSSEVLGQALITVVSGAYLLAGILFALVAIEEDSVIDKKFNDINKVL